MSYLDDMRSRLEKSYGIDSLSKNDMDFSTIEYREDFKDDPSYRLARYKQADKEETTKDIRVVNFENEASKKKAYLVPKDSLNVGDYLYFDNSWWIVTEFESNKTSPYGTLLECTQFLKWEDEDGIHEFPVGLGNEGYGTSFLNSIFYDDRKIKIKIHIQKNKESLNIKLDTRIIFEHSEHGIYEIQDMNLVEYKGVLILTAQKTAKMEEDNLEENLAFNKRKLSDIDNKEENKDDIEDKDTPSKNYVISGESILHRNKKQIYTITPELENYKWKLDDDTIDLEMATVIEFNESSCTILNNNTYNDEMVELQAYVNDEVVATIKLTCKR